MSIPYDELPPHAAMSFSVMLAAESTRDPSASPMVLYSRATMRSIRTLFAETRPDIASAARIAIFHRLSRGRPLPSDEELSELIASA
jgi:hypothetical protein